MSKSTKDANACACPAEPPDERGLAEWALDELPGAAIVIFDRGLRVRLAGGDALGVAADAGGDLVGRRVRDVLPAEVALAAIPHCRGALAGGESTCTLRSPDGRTAFLVQTKPLRSKAGDVVAGLAVTRDVSPAEDSPDPAADVVCAGRPELLRFPPPALRPQMIPRHTLMVRIETAGAQVVLMTAPAGSGKTTAAAQLAAAAPRGAWISLEERHNEPAVLAGELLAAIASIEGARPLGSGMAAGAGLELVAQAVSECATRFVLVLDDAHNLRARGALDVIACAMRNVPRGSLLVIGSRTELDLGHGGLVASRSLLHLRAKDLAMSAAECTAVVASLGTEISVQDVEALVRRTDGWAAGVSLLAGALAEKGGDARLDDVGGWEPSIAGYLRDAVLESLRDGGRKFLLESSPIEELSGPLCDAALGRRDSGRMLRRLVRGNVPITAVDERCHKYRVNPLLREALVQELRAEDPEGTARIHLRASTWCEQNGDVERAIHHARAAGAIDHAGELVAVALPDYVLSRRHRIADLVREFRPEELRREHHLALARGWDALCSGATEATAYWADVAEGALGHPNGDSPGSTSGPLALLRAAAAFGGVSEMAHEAARAYRSEAPGSAWRPFACYLEGAAAELLGDREHACARLREGEQLAAIGAPTLRPQILAQLSQLADSDDQPEASRELAATADAVMYEHGLHGATSDAIVEARSALHLAKDGNEAKARDRLDRAAAELAAPGWMPSWMRAQTQIVLGQAHLQLGDAPIARTLERAARRAIHEGARDAPVLCQRLTSLRAMLDAFPAVSITGSGHLTTAELRVLRYLPTHLSFRQIGERLYLSRHTVKTEAISAYRKLGVNSRSDAVRKARELGILE
jgi:LuxR family transcriptional regulator, maltose regulon positive regulatory protein